MKPCPFCGNKDMIVVLEPAGRGYFSDRYFVLCEYTGLEQGCGAAGPVHKSEALAIETWNRREQTP